jgi:hypothetical protein
MSCPARQQGLGWHCRPLQHRGRQAAADGKQGYVPLCSSLAGAGVPFLFCGCRPRTRSALQDRPGQRAVQPSCFVCWLKSGAGSSLAHLLRTEPLCGRRATARRRGRHNDGDGGALRASSGRGHWSYRCCLPLPWCLLLGCGRAGRPAAHVDVYRVKIKVRKCRVPQDPGPIRPPIHTHAAGRNIRGADGRADGHLTVTNGGL